MAGRRILLLMLGSPLPFGNAMGKWYHVLLKGLVERGNSVTAFATCTTRDELEQTKALFASPHYDLRCYLPDGQRGFKSKLATLRRPYSYPLSSELQRDLESEISRGFDVLHLEVLWSAWLGLSHTDRAVVNVPYLYQIDWADQSPHSWRERISRYRTYRAERYLLRQYPAIIGVSPRLATRIREIAPRSAVHAIPFAMDLSLYPFLDKAVSRDRAPTIGLIASFNWTPGYTAGTRLLLQLWPEIKRRVPDAKLQLAGYHARTVFRDYMQMPDVSIEDHVSDVQAFFRGIDVQLYAPNPSSGMKFKVLESFAFGVPVVTNIAGVEGIPAQDGIHAGICENDKGLIERTVTLLQDPQLADDQRIAARALLEAHCRPDTVLDKLEQVYALVAR